MARSQNGWTAFTSGSDKNLVAIEEVVGRVRAGDVALIFQHFLARFHREVEAVNEAAGQPQNDWGWASRPIRGGVATSNHASGTALDINSDKHVLGKVNTFNVNQRAALRRLLNDFGGVIRWGGDYSGRKDEMHFEINVPEGHPAVRNLAQLILDHGGPGSIHGGAAPAPSVPRPPAKPGVAAPPFPLGAGKYFGPEGKGPNSISGYHSHRAALKQYQSRMKARGWNITADGLYGPKGAKTPQGNTAEVTKKFQRQVGLKADGLIGPATWSYAWTAPIT